MTIMEEKERFHYQDSKKNNDVNIENIKSIYEKLIDDESKKIFASRLLFSITNDWKYIKEMLLETKVWNTIDNIIKANGEKELFIYGAGIAGSRIPKMFPDYKWAGYIDINKKGTRCNNLAVYGIEKIEEISKGCLILISNVTGADEIRKTLINMQIPDKYIITCADYTKSIAKSMYFEDECIDKKVLKGKTFIDAGAYDGLDTVRFLDWVNDNNADVILFEADKNNFEIVKNNLCNYLNICLYNEGLSDNTNKLSFVSGKGEMSNFSREGDEIIQMNYLDNIISNQKIGYIKMDIEGYEKEALSGAKKILSEQKPVLAISVYHKREDIWEIPKLILECNSNYKFYLRHYSLGVVDTVLYAV